MTKLHKGIISIAGGKGGTGKSFLTANLGAALALLGNKVIIIDTDFGCPNLNQFTSVRKPQVSLTNFFLSENYYLPDLVVDTSIDNLKIIPCGSKAYGIANLPYGKKRSLLDKIRHLEADYILIDIGAGSNFNTIDFFNLSDEGILVSSPNSISRTNSMIFLKTALYRKIIQTIRQNKEVWAEITKYIKEKKREAFDINAVLTWVVLNSKPMVVELHKLLNHYKPRFMFNNVQDQDVKTIAHTIIRLTKQHLQIDLGYIGAVRHDHIIENSDDVPEIFLLQHPNSKGAEDIFRVATRAIDHHHTSYKEFVNIINNITQNTDLENTD
ncbi:P-loop NTPase [candidate division KSB1 bacterium]